MNRKHEKDICVRCLAVILAVQFVLIAVSNMTLIESNIDCDNAKMFVHIMEMWKQKTIAIPGWSYVSTLELDCASILALPLYALTGNIYQSFAIANIILLGFFIAVLFYLFSDKDVRYPILTANLLCIPYATGMLDYYNMLFFAGSQYVLKVMLPLLCIAIFVRMNAVEGMQKRDWMFALLFLTLFFVTSMSSGIYVLLIGIVPIIVAYFLYKIMKSEKLLAKQLVFMGMTVAIGMAGICLNKLIMGGARGNSDMVVIWVHQVLANVSSCITGIFELFGAASYTNDLPVLSFHGIAIVAKCCMVILFLICGMVASYKLIKKKIDLRITLLLSVFIWNLFVLLITNTRAGSATYEYRYHLIGMIPLMCISSTVLLDALEILNAFQKKIFSLAGVFIIIIMNTLSFKVVFNGEDTCLHLKELCAYCDELDLDYVYLYDASNDADMCRLIQGDGAPLYLCLTLGGSTWAYDYYEKYVDGEINPNKAIVAIKNSGEVLPDTLDLYGFQMKKLTTVAERDLYYFVEDGMNGKSFTD